MALRVSLPARRGSAAGIRPGPPTDDRAPPQASGHSAILWKSGGISCTHRGGDAEGEAMTDENRAEDPPPGSTFAAERCVARAALDKWAARRPNAVFAAFPDGERWTYREFRERVGRAAAGLRELGVSQGDTVLVWLPNGPAALTALFAVNYIGAVAVPINTAYKGALLEHVIANSGAQLMIADAALAGRLADVRRCRLQTLVLLGESRGAPGGLRALPFSALDSARAGPAPLDRPIEPWDTQSIIYTSGTSGPSKGVLSSYMHAFSSVGPNAWPCVSAEDRFLINLPMFHIGGFFITHAMLCAGGSIAMVERFSTEHFWDEVRRTESTVVFLLGITAGFLMQRPADGRDRDHPLRRAFVVPLTQAGIGFGERFRVETYTIFNMTEIATATVSGPNPRKPGSCGGRRPGIDIRLVDANDCEVPHGSVGEMILRTERPWAMNHGYNRDAEATARAWRNGWFHTGDAFYIDEDGEYVFVDRMKDAIRRRGENISSVEVEAELLAYPGVREAAAIAVPGDGGEDEVLAVLALEPGAGPLDMSEFIAFLSRRMAYFMVPRYVRVLPELPKTPTAKIRKAELRREGLTADTWDREKAGISVQRK
jgi:crotonobetaine/carnitine-CoA ligase